MCEPASITAITLAVISASTAIYSSNQQKHAVEAQAKAQQTQIDHSAQAQTDDRMKAAREQRAAARSAAAEAGVSGNSSDAVLNDIMMQQGQDVSRIEKNRENGIAETSQEVRARSSEINGQLTASLASSAAQGYLGYMKGKSNSMPKIPVSSYMPDLKQTF